MCLRRIQNQFELTAYRTKDTLIDGYKCGCGIL